MWTDLDFFFGLNFFRSPLPFLETGSAIFPVKEVDVLLPIPGCFLKGFPVGLPRSARLGTLKFPDCGPLCLAAFRPCCPLAPFPAGPLPLLSFSFFTFSFFTERFTLIFRSSSWEPFSFSANMTASVFWKERKCSVFTLCSLVIKVIEWCVGDYIFNMMHSPQREYNRSLFPLQYFGPSLIARPRLYHTPQSAGAKTVPLYLWGTMRKVVKKQRCKDKFEYLREWYTDVCRGKSGTFWNRGL